MKSEQKDHGVPGMGGAKTTNSYNHRLVKLYVLEPPIA